LEAEFLSRLHIVRDRQSASIITASRFVPGRISEINALRANPIRYFSLAMVDGLC
jgi:hypothetical protein